MLEKIAGQSRQKSINITSSDRIKEKIDTNNEKIKETKEKVKEKQNEFTKNPTAEAYLKLLNDVSQYSKIKSAYQSAQFWHPNKVLLLQTLFLLPLIVIAYLWHTVSTRKNKGLQALLSWHLLLIFCIPLLIKFFEFLQFGNIVRVVLESITALLGGLLFIASYGLILIIPLFGFGLIKFLQVFIFNPRVQAKNRIQKVHCLRCNSKL
ncbi:MAG: zinc ribbon domain-containing protein, partial [Acaryochloridaceae cyanobacterium RU_4_10]|nr:zinc ribbon domain-containing protein [Acaryochloridaceae cyanobacterium RU_4_10]